MLFDVLPEPWPERTCQTYTYSSHRHTTTLFLWTRCPYKRKVDVTGCCAGVAMLIRVVCHATEPHIWLLAGRCFEGNNGFLLVKSESDLTQTISSFVDLTATILLMSPERFERTISAHVDSRLRSPVVYVLATKPDDSTLEWYIRRGCSGIVYTTDGPEIWRKAVCSVAAGELWFPRKACANVLRMFLALEQRPSSYKLTARETQVLELIGTGYRNQDIANLLFISKETVRWHVRMLYSKLGVASREGAIQLWRSNLCTGNGYPKDNRT